jgi:hypothetical protein
LRATLEQRALADTDPSGGGATGGRRGPREDVYDGAGDGDDDTRGACDDGGVR